MLSPTNTGDPWLDAINGVAHAMGFWLVPFFLVDLILGAAAIIMAFLPTRFQQEYCTNCKSETDQFLTKKSGGYVDVWRKNNSKEETYVCDKCGNKMVATIAEGAPVCRICDKKMQSLDPTKDLWYCEQDRRLFYGAENRLQENVDKPGQRNQRES